MSRGRQGTSLVVLLAEPCAWLPGSLPDGPDVTESSQVEMVGQAPLGPCFPGKLILPSTELCLLFDITGAGVW